MSSTPTRSGARAGSLVLGGAKAIRLEQVPANGINSQPIETKERINENQTGLFSLVCFSSVELCSYLGQLNAEKSGKANKSSPSPSSFSLSLSLFFELELEPRHPLPVRFGSNFRRPSSDNQGIRANLLELERVFTQTKPGRVRLAPLRENNRANSIILLWLRPVCLFLV